MNTCEDALRLAGMIGHPRVVLHLDVKAMYSEGEPTVDLIRRHGHHAGHFHANDANRRGPGFGEVDFVRIFQALRASGYDRWVSVEVFDYTPDPETIARRSLDYMRECLNRADASGPISG
jgi:sugar phosphate isomerase/epimerase